MPHYIKQKLFIFIGLLIILGSFFLNYFQTAYAGLQNGDRFEDWTANCQQINPRKKTCFLIQQVHTTKDSKQEIIAFYQIGFFNNKKTNLTMVQTLLNDISIIAGTSIIQEGKLVASGKFTICNQNGCKAVVDLSKTNLNQILSGEKTILGYLNSNGQQINLPFSTHGLREGVNALKNLK